MADSSKLKDTGHGRVTVVVAVDGSTFADYALQFYVEKMHSPGNKVYLVHSVEYKSISVDALAWLSNQPEITSITDGIEAEQKQADVLEEKLQMKTSALKLEAEVCRLQGDAGQQIVQFAKEKNASYIVVGCRGIGIARRTFLGSVSDFVLHNADIPVLVVRNEQHVEQDSHTHHHSHRGYHLNPFHSGHHHHHHGHHEHGGHQRRRNDSGGTGEKVEEPHDDDEDKET